MFILLLKLAILVGLPLVEVLVCPVGPLIFPSLSSDHFLLSLINCAFVALLRFARGTQSIRLQKLISHCLFLAPVVRHDAFYALLFCLAVRVYVYFSPHLSRGSTGWMGVGGGGGRGGLGGGWGGLIAFCRLLPVASSFRHAPDVTLYRSSLAILDTLMMLRSIDLLLQSSTRSWCYAL